MNKEYQVAGFMAVTAMFTLVGYEFVRSAATVLFKNAYGAENLPLVMAAATEICENPSHGWQVRIPHKSLQNPYRCSHAVHGKREILGTRKERTH